MQMETLGQMFVESVKSHSDRPALGFVGEKAYSYLEMAYRVSALMQFLDERGIGKDDKVAILSTNQPNWGVAYFAIVSMGAVAVPILPDFHEDEISNILKHSEAKALLISQNLYKKVDTQMLASIPLLMLLDQYAEFTADTPENDLATLPTVLPTNRELPRLTPVAKDDLAAIIYTSGTTGKSKGVMLTHWNLVFTVMGCMKLHYIKSNDRILSLLPLSHTLENTVAFLLPIHAGASVWYMKKLPTPAVLLPALQIVKPTIVLSVPLIIEKIYKGKVLPNINKKLLTRKLYQYTPTRKLLNRVAGKKLLKTFGGHLEFFGIGGAKLDPGVEQFMLEANFPYAVGYGLTETAPLLAGFDVFKGRFQSTGHPIEGVTLKIHEPDPQSGEGEIWAKGDNVMKGYYKEPELTAEVITPDGWFRTGDLGCVDNEGFVFIKGRLKNMIVGASGENIYPEEIEAVINRFKHVLESLVVQEEGRLVAMVHFNREELESKFHHLKERAHHAIEQHLKELSAELHQFVNERVNKFSRIQQVITHHEPFEKTATKKIKRFLYK